MKKHTLIVTALILIYGNLLGQTFTRITTGDIVNDGGNGYGMAWGDYDNDGLIDLIVSIGTGENFLYKNNGDGSFTQIFTVVYLGTHYQMVVALIAIILTLIIKPSGLFGQQKELEERV